MHEVVCVDGEFVELLGGAGGEAVGIDEVFRADGCGDFRGGLQVRGAGDALPVCERADAGVGGVGVAILAVVVVDVGVELRGRGEKQGGVDQVARPLLVLLFSGPT